MWKIKRMIIGTCVAASLLGAHPAIAHPKGAKHSPLKFGDTIADGSGKGNETLMPYLQTIDSLGKNLQSYLDKSEGFIKLQSAGETFWKRRDRRKH